MRVDVDTEPLSDYEQPLPIRECDAVRVTPMERHGHGGAGVRGAASRRHEVMRRTRHRYRIANSRYQITNVTLDA